MERGALPQMGNRLLPGRPAGTDRPGHLPGAQWIRAAAARRRAQAASHGVQRLHDRRLGSVDHADDPHRRQRWRARATGGDRAHGLHQLPGHLDRDDHDFLWLRPGAVRQRVADGALPVLLRHVGGDAAVVEAMAGPVPLRSVRVVVAQPCAASVAAVPEGAADGNWEGDPMRIVALLYGAGCYVVFFLTFLYAIGFVGGFVVPRTVDAGGPRSPMGMALLVNVALLGVFGLQHSVMARQGFERVWTRLVPEPVERSTYVLFSSLALILLFW